MARIRRLTGREILDSRGRPTVEASCLLESGALGVVSVPSGASTGIGEALELRDGDPSRYRGLGCRQAAANVGGVIDDALRGLEFDQSSLDEALIKLDGTPSKSRLGANALLAVSLAFARASAAEAGIPLYAHFGAILGQPAEALPRTTINLFSGGRHAGGQVAIQDVLLVPLSARTIDAALQTVFSIYQAAAEITHAKYGMRALSADEGGLAPPFPDSETMLRDAVEAIEKAGFQPGRDVALAVDVASSQFHECGEYHMDGETLNSEEMIARILRWLSDYPIVSVEDGLSEQDWAHWPQLKAQVAGRALVLGDDLLCTNPLLIHRAIDNAAADALLLKVNQIGTLSEAAAACRLARGAGWSVTVSARSGETTDDWLADLSVGWSGNQIKVGSITQGERLSKYNRLLAIEEETGFPVAPWPVMSD
jgi:enolase